MSLSGGALAHEFQTRAGLSEIGEAHSVAVHRRDVDGRLRSLRDDVGRERATERIRERQIFAFNGRAHARQYAFERLVDAEQRLLTRHRFVHPAARPRFDRHAFQRA